MATGSDTYPAAASFTGSVYGGAGSDTLSAAAVMPTPQVLLLR